MILFHINIASERILPVSLNEEDREKMWGKAAGQPYLPVDTSSSIDPSLFWLRNSDADFSLPCAFTRSRSMCNSVSAQAPSTDIVSNSQFSLFGTSKYFALKSFSKSIIIFQDRQLVWYFQNQRTLWGSLWAALQNQCISSLLVPTKSKWFSNSPG